MFANLSDREVTRLVGTLEKIVFSAGEVIITEGETGAEMYVLEEGVCSCTKQDVANGAELRKYEAGDVFGERALLQDERRLATITAASPEVRHFSGIPPYSSGVSSLKQCGHMIPNR